MSAEITRRLEDIAGGGGTSDALGDRMRNSVVNALFLTGTLLVLTEAEQQCASDDDGGPMDRKVESALMGQVAQSFQRSAGLALGEVGRASVTLTQACEELKRLMLGLDSIRVLCRVEAGRMSGGAEGLQAIIKTLDRFHADVASKLNRIQDLARRIRASAEAAARAER
jgi:aerotaxis receptor